MVEKIAIKVWVWLQGCTVMKAVYHPATQTLSVFAEDGKVLMKRTGVTPSQLEEIEKCFAQIGAKRIDDRKEPFTCL